MYYDVYHNHKWARNLAHARRLLNVGDVDAFYHGQDLPENDVYPGVRVMAAYWISVEHEMRMRLRMLLEGSGHPAWREDPEVLAQRDRFVERFLDDMRALVAREQIVPPARVDALVADGYEMPEDWAVQMAACQTSSEEALALGEFPTDLVEAWFDTCLRSVANYNRYLIWGAVVAAAVFRREGADALRAAVDATADAFMWEISREFYVHVLPAAGFQELDELMELGLRGMYSDQIYVAGEAQEIEGGTVKQSILKNCELGGVFQRVAQWNDLPKTALGYAVCRYCEVHGAATMDITIPPMYHPTYRRIRSVGMDDTECLFELTLSEADDMARLMSVHARVFGEAE